MRIRMRRLFAVACLCLSAVSARASEPSSGGIAFDTAALISEGVFRNEADIRANAALLSPSERFSLYEQHKKTALFPFVANHFVGFGVGSFIQGDSGGAAFGLTTQLVGWGMFMMYIIPALGSLDDMFSGRERGAVDSVRMEALSKIGIGGLFLVGVGRLFGLIRPWYYASAWNGTLSAALEGPEGAEVSLIPHACETSFGAGVLVRF